MNKQHYIIITVNIGESAYYTNEACTEKSEDINKAFIFKSKLKAEANLPNDGFTAEIVDDTTRQLYPIEFNQIERKKPYKVKDVLKYLDRCKIDPAKCEIILPDGCFTGKLSNKDKDKVYLCDGSEDLFWGDYGCTVKASRLLKLDPDKELWLSKIKNDTDYPVNVMVAQTRKGSYWTKEDGYGSSKFLLIIDSTEAGISYQR